jgi:hypothetical protein
MLLTELAAKELEILHEAWSPQTSRQPGFQNPEPQIPSSPDRKGRQNLQALPHRFRKFCPQLAGDRSLV